nr:MAG TPA: hypothetical protein [Caudoviricetes sp.]
MTKTAPCYKVNIKLYIIRYTIVSLKTDQK